MLALFFIAGCEKYKLDSNREKILGTWVSLDKTDTLDFADNRHFYKSTSEMRYDRYNYELFVDSIEIGYNGILYILVKPTHHKYSMDEDRLTIDFSNKSCYGFSRQETTYTKE